MKKLVWFRSDLRVQDNSALKCAQDADVTLACVFLPIKQLAAYGHGERKIHFLRGSSQYLSTELEKLGIRLVYAEVDYFGDQIDSLIELCHMEGIQQVFWNNEYPLDERNRDLQAEQELLTSGIGVSRFDDCLILPPQYISTGKGEFYRVFTPFKRAWITCFEQQKSTLINKLDRTGGKSAITEKLHQFIQESVNSYKSKRDYPALDATSHLSASLSAGTLSPLRALSETLIANQGEISEGSVEITTWMSQLIWREFYYHLAARHDSISKNLPFLASTKSIKWNDPGLNLNYWKQGLTGIPIVDAGMRQLSQTGWMHNRLRMITAMFLSKNLLINWRHGERHFLEQLEDGDFALNNGGWQWSSSTGTDATPYFRIFNPFTQAERFDPDAKFIKRFVPELESLPARIIHSEPNLAHHRPKNYPPAIVSTGISRKAAINVFKNL